MRSSRAYDYFFTLDIYTTTFIVANYYSIDWSQASSADADKELSKLL